MRTAFFRRGLVACGLGLLVVARPAAAQQTIRDGFGAVRAQAGRAQPSGTR